MSGKGDRRRPCRISADEEALRWAIWREKDEDKKATLIAELEAIIELEEKWRQAQRAHPHLWGYDNENSAD